MLEIRLLEARGEADHATAHDIFGADFLIRRPLLQALESTDGVAPVLLIDEIDRADEEFEAYLLEILSDFQVTVPEIGTIKAETPPRVILTSNRTREVHDALKRRCLYHWIDYPTAQKEYEIVLAKVPEAPEQLAREVVALRPSPARGGPDQGAGHRRDARLGRRRCCRSVPASSRPSSSTRRSASSSSTRRTSARSAARGRGAICPRPPPAADRGGTMGAWGTAAFDNDDASDWVYDLEKRGHRRDRRRRWPRRRARAPSRCRRTSTRSRPARSSPPLSAGRPTDLREDILRSPDVLRADVTPDHAARAQCRRRACPRRIPRSPTLWGETDEGRRSGGRSIDDLIGRLADGVV